jgi:hypothetical protein
MWRESHIFRACLVPGHGWPCHGVAVAARNPTTLAMALPQLIRATRRTVGANDKEKKSVAADAYMNQTTASTSVADKLEAWRVVAANQTRP